MAIVGLDGRFLKVNRQMARELRQPQDALRKLRFQDITDRRDIGSNLAQQERMLRGDISTFRTEKRYIDPRGNPFWAELKTKLLRTPDGTPEAMMSVVHNIDARKLDEAKLRALAYGSRLPELGSRETFLDAAAGLLGDAITAAEPCAVAVITLRSVSPINKQWGFAAGDQALMAAARRLRDAAGAHALVSRIGGNEFGVVFRPYDPCVIARIFQAFQEPVVLECCKLPMDISLGLALSGEDGNDLPALMQAAALRRLREEERSLRHAIRAHDMGAPRKESARIIAFPAR